MLQWMVGLDASICNQYADGVFHYRAILLFQWFIGVVLEPRFTLYAVINPAMAPYCHARRILVMQLWSFLGLRRSVVRGP